LARPRGKKTQFTLVSGVSTPEVSTAKWLGFMDVDHGFDQHMT
jgi:hypothetical protein